MVALNRGDGINFMTLRFSAFEIEAPVLLCYVLYIQPKLFRFFCTNVLSLQQLIIFKQEIAPFQYKPRVKNSFP